MTVELDHVFIKTNGVTLHVVQAGPEDGPLVILLHGFPEFWYGWHEHIAGLAAKGYRVLVPDQRGYNTSDKPQGIEAYKTGTLAQDVIGLIDAAGRDKASIVGHDWGAAVAWATALNFPQRVERLVTLNVPHPYVMQRNLQRNPRQLLRSWYMFYFQIPRLPEFLFGLGGWRSMARTLRATSHKGTFSDDDLLKYKAAWSQPGAMTAMLNWYRAAIRLTRSVGGAASTPRIHVPTLLIWGKEDFALGVEMAQPSIDLCDDGRLIVIPDATHWVQHEAAVQVQALIADFLPQPTHAATENV